MFERVEKTLSSLGIQINGNEDDLEREISSRLDDFDRQMAERNRTPDQNSDAKWFVIKPTKYLKSFFIGSRQRQYTDSIEAAIASALYMCREKSNILLDNVIKDGDDIVLRAGKNVLVRVKKIILEDFSQENFDKAHAAFQGVRYCTHGSFIKKALAGYYDFPAEHYISLSGPMKYLLSTPKTWVAAMQDALQALGAKISEKQAQQLVLAYFGYDHWGKISVEPKGARSDLVPCLVKGYSAEGKVKKFFRTTEEALHFMFSGDKKVDDCSLILGDRSHVTFSLSFEEGAYVGQEGLSAIYCQQDFDNAILILRDLDATGESTETVFEMYSRSLITEEEIEFSDLDLRLRLIYSQSDDENSQGFLFAAETKDGKSLLPKDKKNVYFMIGPRYIEITPEDTDYIGNPAHIRISLYSIGYRDKHIAEHTNDRAAVNRLMSIMEKKRTGEILF